MRHVRLLALLGVVCLASQADVRVVEEIIAKVNGDIITMGDLDRSRHELETEARGYVQSGKITAAAAQEELAKQQKDLLGKRIDELLLAQKGKELNLNVDSEVSRYLNDLKLKAGIADDEKFSQYIREQTGQTYEDFKQETRNAILTRRVIGEEVARRINIPDSETRAYYDAHKNDFMRQEEVYLSELFLTTQGKTAAQETALEKKAKDLVARARKGERFSDLVDNNSDADSKKDHGLLPAVRKGDMDPIIEKTVFTMKKGAVTDPIKRPNGWLILKVEDHYQAGLADYEAVKNQIMGAIAEQRMQPEVRKYLTKLRQDAFLEIKPGYTDSFAVAGKDTAWKDPAKLTPQTVTKEEVAKQKKHRRLLGVVPVPGTSKSPTNTQDIGTSTSKSLGPSK